METEDGAGKGGQAVWDRLAWERQVAHHAIAQAMRRQGSWPSLTDQPMAAPVNAPKIDDSQAEHGAKPAIGFSLVLTAEILYSVLDEEDQGYGWGSDPVDGDDRALVKVRANGVVIDSYYARRGELEARPTSSYADIWWSDSGAAGVNGWGEE